MSSERVIYTVGYGAMRAPAELVRLATGLDATIVDVRGRATSRKRGFGGRQLRELLGARYAWMGDRLGGVHHLANATRKWPAGVRALAAAHPRAVLMCQCPNPTACHRNRLAFELERQGLARVVHVADGEAIDAAELARSDAEEDDYDPMFWDDPRDLLATWEGRAAAPPRVAWDPAWNEW